MAQTLRATRSVVSTSARATRLVCLNPGLLLLSMLTNLLDPSLTDLIGQSEAFRTVSSSYGLSHFDLDVILLALAPELDLRYERVFAFVQDDVSRRRPSVDLALKLLCTTPELRMHNRRRFAPGAPLLRHDLIHLISDPNFVEPTLLGADAEAG